MGDNDLSVKENPWRKKSTAPSPPPEIPATPPATPDDEPPPPKTFDSVFISGHLCPPPLRQQAPFIPDCLGGSIGVRFVKGEEPIRLSFGYNSYHPENTGGPVHNFSVGIGSELLTGKPKSWVRRSHVASLNPTLIVLPEGDVGFSANVQTQDGLMASKIPGIAGVNLFVGQTAALAGDSPYQLLFGVELSFPNSHYTGKKQPLGNWAYGVARIVPKYRLGQISQDAWNIPGLAEDLFGYQLDGLNAAANDIPATLALQSAFGETDPKLRPWIAGGMTLVGGILMGHGWSQEKSSVYGVGDLVAVNGAAGFANVLWPDQNRNKWTRTLFRSAVATANGGAGGLLMIDEETRPFGMSMMGPTAGILVFDLSEHIELK